MLWLISIESKPFKQWSSHSADAATKRNIRRKISNMLRYAVWQCVCRIAETLKLQPGTQSATPQMTEPLKQSEQTADNSMPKEQAPCAKGQVERDHRACSLQIYAPSSLNKQNQHHEHIFHFLSSVKARRIYRWPLAKVELFTKTSWNETRPSENVKKVLLL